MRKLSFLVLFVLTTLLFACSGNNNDNNNNENKDSLSATESTEALVQGQRYGIKSGIVYYEPVDVMGMKSTQVLYFDDYGKKECREITVEGDVMGIKRKNAS